MPFILSYKRVDLQSGQTEQPTHELPHRRERRRALLSATTRASAVQQVALMAGEPFKQASVKTALR